jgi:hypothetical protein
MLPDLPALSLSDIGYRWNAGLSLWLGAAAVALIAMAVHARKGR